MMKKYDNLIRYVFFFFSYQIFQPKIRLFLSYKYVINQYTFTYLIFLWPVFVTHWHEKDSWESGELKRNLRNNVFRFYGITSAVIFIWNYTLIIFVVVKKQKDYNIIY